MSPSEADLRAALREGEGDRVDPDDIISTVRHTRARHRTMLLSAAAAVAVVGATTAGVTALVNGAGSPNGAAGAAAQGQFNAGNKGVAGSAGAYGGPQHLHRRATIALGPHIAAACAARQGLGPLRPGTQSSGSLLPEPVKEFVICASSIARTRSSVAPRPVVVTGPAARQLAHSLLRLSATSRPADCPMVASTASTVLRIVPVTPSGQHLPTITADVGLPTCASLVTNGSTVRYGWRVPPRVAALADLSNGLPGSFQLIPPSRGASGAPPR